jgi:LysR family glycine cleavage system transcriptional activator
MLRLRAKLPPLSGLVVFEAAGRHLSFTRAAAEMSITQAAVSRQIRGLEEHLGARLFVRGGRALHLTAEGRRLHHAVTMGLEHIANVVLEIRSTEGDARVTVATTLAFASFWLMPRIPRFRAAHPDVDLRVVASDRPVDAGGEDVDVVIRYGRATLPGFRPSYLLDEEIFPVCSPRYLEGRPFLEEPADLLHEVLLHLDEDDPHWINWHTWLQLKGVHAPTLRRGLRVNNYPMLIQAALDGQGIALGWRHLVDGPIERGTLVRPIDASLHTEEAFYLLTPADRQLGAETAAFRDWILAEVSGRNGAPTNA